MGVLIHFNQVNVVTFESVDVQLNVFTCIMCCTPTLCAIGRIILKIMLSWSMGLLTIL